MFMQVGVVSNVPQQRQMDLALRTWPSAQGPGLGLAQGQGLVQGQGQAQRTITDRDMTTPGEEPLLSTTLTRPVRQQKHKG